MSATIRRAAAADAQDIARIHVDTWRTAYQGIVPQAHLDSLDAAARAAMWQAACAKGDLYTFVAEDKSGACGFISGGVAREATEDYDAEIYAIYVRAGSQHRGLGTRLVSVLAEALVQNGFSRLMVWVLADNPCRNFYAMLGGTSFAERSIEIGGVQLIEVAYGWENIGELTRPNAS